MASLECESAHGGSGGRLVYSFSCRIHTGMHLSPVEVAAVMILPHRRPAIQKYLRRVEPGWPDLRDSEDFQQLGGWGPRDWGGAELAVGQRAGQGLD